MAIASWLTTSSLLFAYLSEVYTQSASSPLIYVLTWMMITAVIAPFPAINLSDLRSSNRLNHTDWMAYVEIASVYAITAVIVSMIGHHALGLSKVVHLIVLASFIPVVGYTCAFIGNPDKVSMDDRVERLIWGCYSASMMLIFMLSAIR